MSCYYKKDKVIKMRKRTKFKPKSFRSKQTIKKARIPKARIRKKF